MTSLTWVTSIFNLILTLQFRTFCSGEFSNVSEFSTKFSGLDCGLRRCRVALISDHSDPALTEIGTEGAGGQNVYVRQVGEHLSHLGWDVDMFTRQWRHQPSVVLHNAHCRTIRLLAGPIRNVPREDLLPHMDQFLESFLQFQAENDLSYDVFFTNYWLSGVIGLNLKKLYPSTPLVHVYHSLGRVKAAFQTSSFHGNLTGDISRYVAESLVLHVADLVISTSRNEARDIAQYYLDGKRSTNVFVIPAGVNPEDFSSRVPKSVARKMVGIPENLKTVLYIGRFDQRKGIGVLVEAIRGSEFPAENLRLVIGGGITPGMADEVEFRRISHLVNLASLQNVTIFPGILTRGNHSTSLQNWYTAADVVVIPSMYEPFGLVTLEAMSMGRPVVASAVGGLQSTVVHGKTGYLVPPGDAEQLSMRIDQILENAALAEALGIAGRKRVEQHFTWNRVAKELNYQLRKLVISAHSPFSPTSEFCLDRLCRVR